PRAYDGAEGKLGVAHVEAVEYLRQAGAQIRGLALRCRGQWRAQQGDAPIGIAAGRGKGCFDGAENALADASAGGGEGSGGGLRAADELAGGHPVAGSVDVNVAGLRRVELVAAGGLERGGDLLRRRSQTVAPRRARVASAAMRSPARMEAMRARVTFCTPDQAGLLLTSSTVGCPSAP